MAAMRRLTASDLHNLSHCNLDHLTETYDFAFYAEYLRKWPECCQVLESPDGKIEAYLLGKLESSPFPPPKSPYSPSTNPNPNYLPWHAHVTVLTVVQSARRLGHATRLSRHLEQEGERMGCWFVDLYVRVENLAAIELYRKLGWAGADLKGCSYSVYRRVVGYYNDESDAFDMRKPLSRDKEIKTIRADGENFRVDPSEVW